MIKTWHHLKRMDWIIALTALALSFFGLLSLYGNSINGLAINFQKQLVFLALGFSLMILFSFFDWRMLKEDSFLVIFLYLISIVFLIGLFFFAPATREVKRWYSLGPVSFDPVEFFKIVLIVLLAKYFSKRHVEMYKFSHIVLSGFYVLIPSVITFFQPDMGSAIILILVWLGILFLSGIRIKHFLILCLIGALFLSLSWSFVLKDYQKTRITSFLEPHLDPQGINWNPEQARIAIGAGGFLGQGIGQGAQTRYGFLPEAQTDFVFSAIAEETGLVGIALLLFLFLVLISRILKIAMETRDNFSRLFCSGFIVLLIVQIFVNVGMNQGILPIVGLPLPLVSYGGSSLIFTFIGLGIIQSIKAKS
jgi:rod shape determining protein RodA